MTRGSASNAAARSSRPRRGTLAGGVGWCTRAALASLWLLLWTGPVAAESASGAWSGSGGGVVDAAYLAQLIVGLFVVVAAIVVLAFVMRRMTGAQAALGRELRIVGGISLGAREKLVLVQVGDTQLLVGVAPGRVQTLHVLDEPIRVDPSDAVSRPGDTPFARRLRAVLQRDGQ